MIAVVPTIGLAPQLPALVGQLLDEGLECVLLTVNERTALPGLRRYVGLRSHVVPIPGTIYEGWNFGLRFARVLNETLAVLNDDVELAPGALAEAERLMATAPDVAILGLDYDEGDFFGAGEIWRCTGTYQHGCVPGWAFLADPRRVRGVDPQFEWWYGDDDLVRQAVADGHAVGVAGGCKVRHEGEASARQRPWTDAAKVRDAARYAAKWGEAR